MEKRVDVPKSHRASILELRLTHPHQNKRRQGNNGMYPPLSRSLDTPPSNGPLISSAPHPVGPALRKPLRMPRESPGPPTRQRNTHGPCVGTCAVCLKARQHTSPFHCWGRSAVRRTRHAVDQCLCQCSPFGGGVGWHKASVSDCLPLAAPIGPSPLLVLTLCGSERVLVVSTEPRMTCPV